MGNWMFEGSPDRTFTTWDANNQTEGGVNFMVNSAGACTALRYWRDGPNRSAPDTIALFGYATTDVLASVSPVADDGTTGWQVTPLPTPVPLTVGERYFCAAHWGVGGGHGVFANPPPPGDPPGATHFAPYRMTAAGTSLVRPVNTGLNPCFALDFYVEWGPSDYPPYGGDSSSDLDATLARWLLATGDRYPGSVLEAQSLSLGTISDGTAELLNRLSAGAGSMLNSLAETLVLNGLDLWTWQQNHQVELVDKLADLAEAVGQFTGVSALEYLAQAGRLLNKIDAPPALAGTDDWELLDETDFTDNLLWPVEADVYRVNLTAFDPAGTSEPFGSLTRHGYLGKWSPVNVSFARQWRYFNTAEADLMTGERMPGLGLILYRPGAGHVQAWRRKEAP